MSTEPLAIQPEAAPPAPAVPLKRTATLLRLCVEAMRPRQWHKNLFVLAGLVFSGQLLEADAQLHAWAAVAAFCLASGAAYLLNDVRDATADRLNPRTSGRAVARGALPARVALVAAAVAAAGALGVAAAVNAATLAALTAFCALQAAYSLRLKRIPGLDVAAISGGFVLRALAGATAVGVAASGWLLACTALLTIFLGLAKRHGELAGLAGRPESREVLSRYARLPLARMLAFVAAATVVVYAVYCVRGPYGPEMLVTLPPVVLGVLRAHGLAQRSPVTVEDPALLSLADRRLGAIVLVWAVAAALVSQLS